MFIKPEDLKINGKYVFARKCKFNDCLQCNAPSGSVIKLEVKDCPRYISAQALQAPR